ncbi:MAG TPA: SPOR domain-containing protein, partial [Longimicrobiales bacterium]|nr:SPOR domain-containing protein [Longimicrobiales bacterium]
LAAGLAAGAAPAAAQVPTLDRVDSLITAGDYEQARATIQRWWSAREAFDVPGSDRVRAHMLRAALQPRIQDAESDYLAVILGHPTSQDAPRALLRLGQGPLADGQYNRAAGYLERLVAEYAGRPERAAGVVWLAQAQLHSRRTAAACRSAAEGLEAQPGRDPDQRELLRQVREAACGDGGAVVAGNGPADESGQGGGPDRPETVPGVDGAAPQGAERAGQGSTGGAEPGAESGAETGRFGAQAGAFRHRDGADDLVEALRGRGHQARIVLVPGSDLLRVRVGRFGSAGEAARAVEALKAAGFDAYVVRDVSEERQP